MRRYAAVRFSVSGWCMIATLTASEALGDKPQSTMTFVDRSVRHVDHSVAQAAHVEPVEAPLADPVETPIEEPALLEPLEAPEPAATLPPPPPLQTPQLDKFEAKAAIHTTPAPPRPMPTSRPVVRYYVGHSAREAMSRFPRRTPIEPSGPRLVQRQGKPFQNVERESTISPYLYLEQDDETRQDIPNYFTYVRPQLEQQEANRVQRRAMQQLNGQMQSMSSTAVGPQYQAGRSFGTGAPARFMDTAQFYGGLR